RQSLARRHGDAIRARIAEHAGTTLEDLKRDLNLDASIANIWYAVQALGLSLKKNAPGSRPGPARCHPHPPPLPPPPPRDRPTPAARPLGPTGIDPPPPAFSGQPFRTTPMTPPYGWGPAGRRVVDAVPPGHWKTTTFVVALRLSGLFAPLVVDGALNGELFVT